MTISNASGAWGIQEQKKRQKQFDVSSLPWIDLTLKIVNANGKIQYYSTVNKCRDKLKIQTLKDLISEIENEHGIPIEKWESDDWG